MQLQGKFLAYSAVNKNTFKPYHAKVNKGQLSRRETYYEYITLKKRFLKIFDRLNQMLKSTVMKMMEQRKHEKAKVE